MREIAQIRGRHHAFRRQLLPQISQRMTAYGEATVAIIRFHTLDGRHGIERRYLAKRFVILFQQRPCRAAELRHLPESFTAMQRIL